MISWTCLAEKIRKNPWDAPGRSRSGHRAGREAPRAAKSWKTGPPARPPGARPEGLLCVPRERNTAADAPTKGPGKGRGRWPRGGPGTPETTPLAQLLSKPPPDTCPSARLVQQYFFLARRVPHASEPVTPIPRNVVGQPEPTFCSAGAQEGASGPQVPKQWPQRGPWDPPSEPAGPILERRA